LAAIPTWLTAVAADLERWQLLEPTVDKRRITRGLVFTLRRWQASQARFAGIDMFWNGCYLQRDAACNIGKSWASRHECIDQDKDILGNRTIIRLLHGYAVPDSELTPLGTSLTSMVGFALQSQDSYAISSA